MNNQQRQALENHRKTLRIIKRESYILRTKVEAQRLVDPTLTHTLHGVALRAQWDMLKMIEQSLTEGLEEEAE